jgi:hypothetical protein
MDAQHDDAVTWADVPIPDPDLTGWHRREGEFGLLSARGPCPVCRGTAWGPPLPEVDDVKLDLQEDAVLEVRDVIEAECHCGREHGKDGVTGCGRYWAVAREAQR